MINDDYWWLYNDDCPPVSSNMAGKSPRSMEVCSWGKSSNRGDFPALVWLHRRVHEQWENHLTSPIFFENSEDDHPSSKMPWSWKMDRKTMVKTSENYIQFPWLSCRFSQQNQSVRSEGAIHSTWGVFGQSHKNQPKMIVEGKKYVANCLPR